MEEFKTIGIHSSKSFTKGKIQVYDPETRQIQEDQEIIFDYVPNDVVVKYNPNFEFLSAPQGIRNFAQFGSTKPKTVSFTLFYAGNVYSQKDIEHISDIHIKLKNLVAPRLMQQTLRLAPPLVRLIMGNLVQGNVGYYPIGVISSLSIKGLSVDHELKLNRFEADIEFTESTTDLGSDFQIKIMTQKAQGNKK